MAEALFSVTRYVSKGHIIKSCWNFGKTVVLLKVNLGIIEFVHQIVHKSLLFVHMPWGSISWSEVKKSYIYYRDYTTQLNEKEQKR